MSAPSAPAASPWPHRWAVALVCATFPLLWVGGLVTTTDAGMAVPDWPTTYGYNMFLFPPSKWVGGIFYEHTHRLMGTVVGLLSIILTIVAWKTEPRRWVRWLATSVLGAVIFQGVLGGLRVVWVELDLAIVHACFAQAFFCLAALMVMATSQWWTKLDQKPCAIHSRYPLVAGASLVVVVFLQLLVGATMRHHDAGLAIPGVLTYGKLLPPSTASEIDQINQSRAWDMGLKPVSMSQVWLNYGHRVGAIAVTLVAGLLIANILRHHRRTVLAKPAIALGFLLLVQITLGVLTIYFRKPADVASAHVAVGALVLVVTFVLTVIASRCCVRERRSAAHESMNPAAAAFA